MAMRLEPELVNDVNDVDRRRLWWVSKRKFPKIMMTSILFYFIQFILEYINAARWNSLPIQGIPAINYPMWKKYFLTSFWNLGLLSLGKWPVCLYYYNLEWIGGDSKWTDVNPLYIFKSSIKSALSPFPPGSRDLILLIYRDNPCHEPPLSSE